MFLLLLGCWPLWPLTSLSSLDHFGLKCLKARSDSYFKAENQEVNWILEDSLSSQLVLDKWHFPTLHAVDCQFVPFLKRERVLMKTDDSEACGLPWVTRQCSLIFMIYMWTNMIILLSDVGEERFFLCNLPLISERWKAGSRRCQTVQPAGQTLHWQARCPTALPTHAENKISFYCLTCSRCLSSLISLFRFSVSLTIIALTKMRVWLMMIWSLSS